MKEWMTEFKIYLANSYPVLESNVEGLGLVDELRAAVCENISLYMEKNEEEFKDYLNDFAQAVWTLLGNVSQSSSRDSLAVMAIKFLTTVSTSVHHTLFAVDGVIPQICQSIVIPNVRLRDEDEELFEMNYIEFIRRDMEGSDIDTRRRIACELLKGIATNYKQQVISIVSVQIQNLLTSYAANPAANWKDKDCAVYLVVSLSTKKAGGSESNVVHSYAASCIEKLLLVKDEGGRSRYTSADVAPNLLVLINNLFTAFRFPESEENQYIMKSIMRVLGVAEITPEIAGPCIAGLTSILAEVCKNPKNPIFNHYLFESVAVLVRRACERDISLIPSFETSLFPILQEILGNDVTEFLPYTFQLLAQLVELNRPPISDIYMEIFKLLLSPDSWTRNSNVPALVRLLQAFLEKAPEKLNQEERLAQVLGIFNRLVSVPSTDEQGFFVLNTVIENLDYGAISPYVGHIWNALFTRLQSKRTVKYIKSLLIFMSLFLVKHGFANLVNSMNSVQAGIFSVILEQFWIPNLKLITGPIEVKLVSVASTRLICESLTLSDAGAARHWG
ncbi:EXPORTIN-2 [Salix viminalis]|uniref:EXPORTIN-2 n=1 Tax=Salix viminalis TaxID=40686 RepID=A0A9Q0UGK5_SALVM|nr:EXPORTIN-2 [Salix viminalis]